MDPQLNQRGRQVLRDARQVIFGEIQFLHVLQGQKCSGVDFGDVVIPQRQTLNRGRKQEAQFNTKALKKDQKYQ